jgi:hypothetical protein
MTFAVVTPEFACSGDTIRTIGSSLDFSRISLQILLPLLRNEAALTTTKSGSTSTRRVTAELPVGTISTKYSFFRKEVTKDVLSVRFPSTHNILAFINQYSNIQICPAIEFPHHLEVRVLYRNLKNRQDVKGFF